MKQTILYSQKFMAESFQRARYCWNVRPEIELDGNYGMYINIPFCSSFCTFCPFYKVLYRKEQINKYLDALIREIGAQKLPGPPAWIYFGGGTPNVLGIEELRLIVEAIRKKCGFPEAGIELMPARVTRDYLFKLKDMGFRKISLGVETLNDSVNLRQHRETVSTGHLEDCFRWAREADLFVNMDLMVGLYGQDASAFINDILTVNEWRPDQITVYPFMVIRGLKVQSGMTEEQQFELIEQTWEILRQHGYSRLSPWTFTTSAGEYDCSKAELVSDYIGFGAGSFTTNKSWKVVNPPVDYYIESIDKPDRKALLAQKDASADHWRQFGWMLTELRVETRTNLPLMINLYIVWLRVAGYIRHRQFTGKGLLLAHFLMKTIVESLPFPIQDTSKIINQIDYFKDCSKRSTYSLSRPVNFLDQPLQNRTRANFRK